MQQWDVEDVLAVGEQVQRLFLNTLAQTVVESEAGVFSGCGKFDGLVKGDVHIYSDDRVWLKGGARNQLAQKTSDEIFTTLDRPAPMSPEMAAIRRMQRANELERERTRARLIELERRNNERNISAVQESAATETSEVLEDAGGGEAIAEGPENAGADGVSVSEGPDAPADGSRKKSEEHSDG